VPTNVAILNFDLCDLQKVHFSNFFYFDFHGQKQKNLNTVVETKMSGVEIFKMFESDLSDMHF
jgi:hypothetical protein